MTAEPEAPMTRYYLRFTLNQRLQHITLIVCMTALVITGMPLRYSTADASAAMVQWMGASSFAD